jgi:hypothetical protein
MEPDSDKMATRRVETGSFDQSTTGPETGRRITVQEAAGVLGISVEAVRARIKRGSLRKEKAKDGTVYVWMDDRMRPDGERRRDQTRSDGDQTSSRNWHAYDQSGDQMRPDADLVGVLREQIEMLHSELDDWKQVVSTRDEELRRKDHIIAALTERIPELEPAREAAPEPRNDSQTVAEADPGPSSSEPGEDLQKGTQRSWWRRLFEA